jgi:tetratricopeptide (TPR) repeat protein
MNAFVFVCLIAIAQPQPSGDEETLRALVQQYFDAQGQKDADRALSFWGASANPRPTREAFAAIFGPAAAQDQFTVTIQRLVINGNEARVRVSAERTRTISINDYRSTMRQTLVNAELWRKETGAWKLVRDGPAAEDFADELLAKPAADRQRMLDERHDEVDASLSHVLASRASMAAAAQQYAKARELFDFQLTVARVAHDRRGESDALQNIANAYYFLAMRLDADARAADFDKAGDYYRQRLTLARDMGDEEAVAASLVGLATVEYSRGEYTPALASYRDALAIYEKRDEGVSIGRTLVSVGNVQYLQGEYDPAAASYRRALSLLVAGTDTQGAAFARSGLARVFVAQGDLPAALETYSQVLADARAEAARMPRTSDNVATALESVGDVYFRLGNTDRARASFDESRRLVDTRPVDAARLFGELGLTELVAGRFDAALANYTDSRMRYELAKDPSGVAHAWVGVGFSQTARRKYDEAETAYHTAIRMLEQQKENEDAARAWLGLSMAQSGKDDRDAALESAQKVVAIAAVMNNPELAWRGGVRSGEALRKLERLDDAKRAFADAIAAIDRIVVDAPVSADARAQLDDSASAWAGLAFTLANAGDARGALAAAEARRAHLRRLQFAPFERDIVRGETTEEQTDERDIIRELISIRAQLRSATAARRVTASVTVKPDTAPHAGATPPPQPVAPQRASDSGDPTRRQKLEEELARLTARRTEQQANLYARLPELRQWRGRNPLPSVADVDALFPDEDTLLLEYIVVDEELLVIAGTRDETGLTLRTTVVKNDRREFADAISRALDPAALRDAAEWARRAEPLSSVILPANLPARLRWLVVPDDLLWKVPFEALRAPSADSALPPAVTYATSLVTYGLQARIADTRGKPQEVTAALVAAPAIPSAVQAQLAIARTGWSMPDASASLQLARDLATAYGRTATVRADADANEAAVRGLLAGTDILYVAAPLDVNASTPLLSSVLLAGTGDDLQNDGRWQAREWFAAETHARLAMLPDASAFGGAGVGGAMDAIAWAAAAAGVPAIVTGRWPSAGFSNAALLKAFNARLAHGESVSGAWRTTVTELRRDRASVAPAEWAGLRLIGATRDPE